MENVNPVWVKLLNKVVFSVIPTMKNVLFVNLIITWIKIKIVILKKLQ